MYFLQSPSPWCSVKLEYSSGSVTLAQYTGGHNSDTSPCTTTYAYMSLQYICIHVFVLIRMDACLCPSYEYRCQSESTSTWRDHTWILHGKHILTVEHESILGWSNRLMSSYIGNMDPCGRSHWYFPCGKEIRHRSWNKEMIWSEDFS